MFKKLALMFCAIAVAGVSSLEAQINPGNGGKTGNDLIAIKTDPVLSDPKGVVSIKPDPVLRQLDTLHLNASALITLLAAMEKSGAKVSYQLVESEGATMLDVSLDGMPVASFIVKCESCEPIVYEY